MNKSESIQFLLIVKESIDRLFEEDPLFIVGVSGGPDSMALLYALHQLQVKCIVVHINYQTRGADSDSDQELVEQIAFQWGFDCVSVRLDQQNEPGNFQNWARKVRYQIFEDMKNEYQASAIMTAHHQDDVVETVLQKLLRKSSPETWKGISEFEHGRFRPLVQVTKQDIFNFCMEHAVPFREDQSNLKPVYQRNQLRHSIFPQLDSMFPGWREHVLNLKTVSHIVDDLEQFTLNQISDSSHTIGIDALLGFRGNTQRSVIRRFLRVNIPGIEVTSGVLEECQSLLTTQTGKRVLLDGKHELFRNRDTLVLIKREADTEDEVIPLFSDRFYVSDKGVRFERVSRNEAKNLYMDIERLKWPLILRQWQAGDRFIPFGMTGTQKVSDHLTNRKVGAHLKENTLVLSDSGGTIYAIIFPEPLPTGELGTISNEVRCTDVTQLCLELNRSL
ncbi:MAG: tRNA lysidine(34) synthetase TilS [Bacteroidota bacterium]